MSRQISSLSNRRPAWFPFALAASAGAATAWYVYHSRHSAFPRRVWQPILAQTYGEEQAQQLADQAETAYQQLLVQGPIPPNRALRKHLVESILPGLAMYRILLAAEAGDQQAALNQISPLFKAWTQKRMSVLIGLMRLSPDPAAFFRLGAALRMNSFPKEGWDFNWQENSSRRIAFDAHSCYYLKTLTAYGAPELTPSFCQIDDWMGEMLPPPVVFRRTQTLGRGGACCDFVYELKESHEKSA